MTPLAGRPLGLLHGRPTGAARRVPDGKEQDSWAPAGLRARVPERAAQDRLARGTLEQRRVPAAS